MSMWVWYGGMHFNKLCLSRWNVNLSLYINDSENWSNDKMQVLFIALYMDIDLPLKLDIKCKVNKCLSSLAHDIVIRMIDQTASCQFRVINYWCWIQRLGWLWQGKLSYQESMKVVEQKWWLRELFVENVNVSVRHWSDCFFRNCVKLAFQTFFYRSANFPGKILLY